MSTRNVRAILIDPFACTVTEVEHDASNYQHIYTLLSHESMPVDCFTCVYSDHLAEGEVIFVDDNGLLKPCDRFFVFADYHQPLAGKGLILGSDEYGDTVAATSDLEAIRARVIFATPWGGRWGLSNKLAKVTTPWVKETVQ